MAGLFFYQFTDSFFNAGILPFFDSTTPAHAISSATSICR
jgi:hypothetical protein